MTISLINTFEAHGKSCVYFRILVLQLLSFLTSFLCLFSPSLRNINMMREFVDKTEYQAFENYDISEEAACHPPFTIRWGSEYSPSTSAARRLIILKNWSFEYMNMYLKTIHFQKLRSSGLRRSIARLQSFRPSQAIHWKQECYKHIHSELLVYPCLCFGLFRKHLKRWFYAEFYMIVKPD